MVRLFFSGSSTNTKHTHVAIHSLCISHILTRPIDVQCQVFCAVVLTLQSSVLLACCMTGHSVQLVQITITFPDISQAQKRSYKPKRGLASPKEVSQPKRGLARPEEVSQAQKRSRKRSRKPKRGLASPKEVLQAKRRPRKPKRGLASPKEVSQGQKRSRKPKGGLAKPLGPKDLGYY